MSGTVAKKEIRSYVVVHEHRHGTDVRTFRSSQDVMEFDDKQRLELAKKLDIDFEPDLCGEYLDIYPNDDGNKVVEVRP